MNRDRRSILIVDDSPDDRAEMRRLLLVASGQRYRFTEADTGSAALRAYLGEASAPYDCILLDYSLPDFDAPELLEELGGPERLACPVVVVTGLDASAIDTSNLFHAGTQDFIGKDWMNPESLSRAVENAVERFALARQLRDSAERYRRLNTELEDRVAERTMELRESEERFRYAMEASTDGLWDWNILTGDSYCNPAYFRMLGYEPDDLPPNVSGHWMDLLHPDDRQGTVENAQKRLASPGHYELEFRLQAKDGGYRWVLSRGRVVEWDESGAPARAVGTHVDLTERKRAEAALQESERRFRVIADSAPVLIWISGLDQGCTFFNKGWLDFTGRSMEQERGSGWIQGVHPDDLQRCLDIYTSSFDARLPFEMEYRLRRYDGQYRWLLDTGRPRYNHEGGFAGYIGSCMDITDRVEMQNRLEEARTAAEAANLAKSRFLANMSHEIRTPLNGILGLTSLMRREGASPSQLERLDKLDGAAQHLLEVINDILDISKIEAGKLSLEEREFDLGAIAVNILAMLKHQAAAKGLRLFIESEAMPNRLVGDSTRLGQTLFNLLGNAIKFTETGSVSLRVRRQEDTPEAVLVRFEVVDTGVGIPPEAVPRLFRSFEQADDSTARRYGGTGLGLAISERLVRLMGGEIGLETAVGAGSTFWFTARFAKIKLTPDLKQEEPERDAEALLQRDHRGRRVLIAEDEPINQEIARELLSAAGLAVELADDGEQALRMAAGGGHDLILMDMQMPAMDGLEATRRIRRLPNGGTVPIIAMTANAFADDRAQCLEAGMNDFIGKPTRPEVLFAMVLKWLARER